MLYNFAIPKYFKASAAARDVSEYAKAPSGPVRNASFRPVITVSAPCRFPSEMIADGERMILLREPQCIYAKTDRKTHPAGFVVFFRRKL